MISYSVNLWDRAESIEEFCTWLKNTYGSAGNGWNWRITSGYACMEFEREEDAVVFALRWL